MAGFGTHGIKEGKESARVKVAGDRALGSRHCQLNLLSSQALDIGPGQVINITPPESLVLLLDTSRSMRGLLEDKQPKLSAAKEAAAIFFVKTDEKDIDFSRDCVMVKIMKTLSINNTINMPPDIQGEVEDFALFLIEKRSKKRYKKLSSLNWFNSFPPATEFNVLNP